MHFDMKDIMITRTEDKKPTSFDCEISEATQSPNVLVEVRS